MKKLLLWFTLAVLLTGSQAAQAETYQVKGDTILKNGAPTQWRGVNTLDVYGLNALDEMPVWHIDIVRIVVSDMQDIPLTGGVQKIGGSYLHSLQEVVKAHRAAGRVVILCPFSWDQGQDHDFLGKNPSQTRWWHAYLDKYRDWATQFQGDPGVWFELWNEPYAWDGGNGYTHDLWLRDAQAMVDNIRAVAPTSIIVVPAGEMSGDETVIADKGPALLKGRKNLVFDVHAYNAWMGDSEPRVEARIRSVQDEGCALVFAECGVSNVGYDLDPTNFLKAVTKLGVPTLAWIWKQDPTDGNTLLGPGNAPYDGGKYHWGVTFQTFTLTPRHKP